MSAETPPPSDAYVPEPNLVLIGQKMKRYIDAPTYTDLTDEAAAMLVDRGSLKMHPSAHTYVQRYLSTVVTEIDQNDYVNAITKTRSFIKAIPTHVQADDLPAAQRALQYKLGVLHETFAQRISSKTHCLYAVEAYLDAEFAVGDVKTDYGIRIACCFGLLGMPDIQKEILVLLLGPNVDVWNNNDPVNTVIIEDLKRRADPSVVNLPGVYFINLPNPEDN